MGVIKTLFKLAIVIVILIIAVPVGIYLVSDLDNSSQSKNGDSTEVSYPTGVEGKTTIFHKQENIQPQNYWNINLEMGYKERIYINYVCHSPTKAMWMDNWDFQRFEEGKEYEYYNMNPNGSDGWGYLESDGIGTWYIVFYNDTDHMKTVNVEIKR